ncbi:MAG: hypothetical protein FJ319_11730 [SAR202 cluster bacterium]|nr:hypothetical protein [SAR202 cluster bacterium]
MRATQFATSLILGFGLAVAIYVAAGGAGTAMAASGTLPLRSGVFAVVHNGVSASTIQDSYGASGTYEPFNGTTSYDFYSAPLSAARSLGASDHGRAEVWVKNSGASALTFKCDVGYYDYNPANGSETLIASSRPSGNTKVEALAGKKCTTGNASFLNMSVPAGHYLKATITLTHISGPTSNEFVYNAPAGAFGDSSLTFNGANGAIDWNFGRFTQEVSFQSVDGKTYGDTDFRIGATVSSRLPLSFSSFTEGVCSVSGELAHIDAAGTCLIVAG